MGSDHKRKKAIILHAPIFFDYHKRIINEIEGLGYAVIFYPTRGAVTSISNFFQKVRISQIISIFQGYFYRAKVRRFNRNYDIKRVIVITGNYFDRKLVDYVVNSELQIAWYLWDSLSNQSIDISWIKTIAFKVITFDKKDSVMHDLSFLSMFSSVSRIDSDVESRKEYDISFVGSYTEYRWDIIRRLALSVRNSRHFMFIYFGSFSQYINFICKNRRFLFKQGMTFSLFSMSNENYEDVLSRSYSILELPSVNQYGFTQRAHDASMLGNVIVVDDERVSQYKSENFLCMSISEYISTNGTVVGELLRNEVPKKMADTTVDLTRWVSFLLE